MSIKNSLPENVENSPLGDRGIDPGQLGARLREIATNDMGFAGCRCDYCQGGRDALNQAADTLDQHAADLATLRSERDEARELAELRVDMVTIAQREKAAAEEHARAVTISRDDARHNRDIWQRRAEAAQADLATIRAQVEPIVAEVTAINALHDHSHGFAILPPNRCSKCDEIADRTAKLGPLVLKALTPPPETAAQGAESRPCLFRRIHTGRPMHEMQWRGCRVEWANQPDRWCANCQRQAITPPPETES